MLRILWGGDTGCLLDSLRERAAKGTVRQIFLVPEQLSHETERLLQTLGDGIGLSAEVLTFQRIAHRVLTHEGGLAEPMLDAGGRILLLSRAVEAVRTTLTEWGRVAGNVNFLTELMATVDELKCHGCKPEYLTGSGKLSDLRVIREAYDAMTANTAIDPRDILTRVAELLHKGDFAKGVSLYIDGFVSFTAQEYDIISAFIKHGDVTALINAPMRGGDEYFVQPKLTASRLIRLAEKTGTAHTSEELAAKRSAAVDDSLKAVDGKVTVFACPDMLTECRLAADTVRRWVEQGVRYRDMAVVTPAWNEYKSILKSVFAGEGIPLFTDDVTPLTEKSAVRFIVCSMEAVLRGFGADEMIALLKTGLTPLSTDDCYMLEDYLRTHNASGVYWTLDKPWQAHPSGWGAKKFSKRDTARLSKLNAMRELLRTPLMKLRRAMSGSGTGKSLVRALYLYCEDMKLPKTLKERCDALLLQDMARLADEYRQLWGIITKCMDGFADILGSETLRPETFARLFELCLTQYDIGVIPVSLDSLQAGALSRLKRRELKRMVIVGANERHMPKRSTSSGLLTDEERIILEGNGIFLAPREDERASRELYSIRAAFTLPSDALAVSYSAADGGQPSMFVDMLGAETELVGREPVTIGSGWKSNREPLSDGSVLLSGKGTLSASRAEVYNSCRWRYFSRYTLRARTRGNWAPSAMDAGTLIHDVLEHMVNKVMEAGGFHTVSRPDALAHAKDAATAWGASLPGAEHAGARVKALVSRLKSAALQVAGNVYDELEKSEFKPLATEYGFTTKDDIPLTGFIDRIDGWLDGGRMYIRVIDYKSGKTSFSLRDVWHGLGIQMLCYLFALDVWQGRETVPAGVLYLPVHDKFAHVDTKASDEEITKKLYAMLKRNGLILNSPEVIEAMERGHEKVFIPVKFNKDGSTDRYSQVAGAARLGHLRQHIQKLMGELAANINSGLVDANPVAKSADDTQCKFCEYAQCCFFNENDSPRWMEPMNSAEFWEKVKPC